jgi:hypothetical protein
MANGRNPNNEMWIARCLKCGDSNLTLAPANQYTHLIPAKWELYCSHCRWTMKIEDCHKTVYVRM